MQLSRFTLLIENYPNSGEHLVYNTRTQALVKVDQEMKNRLDRLKLGFVESDWSNGHRADAESLFRMGILVHDEADDAAKLDRFMEQKKYGVSREYFLATILTTYNCNFACTYCFEESTRTSNQKLDLHTCDQIVTWLKNKVTKIDPLRLDLNFYGGEPLLNQAAIEYLVPIMKPWAEGRGMKFGFSLQTNGALLTPALVDRYLPMNLSYAQVSLDGVKEVHDRNRPMRSNGEGTFDAIIRNLTAVADRVPLKIAAGYDKGDPQSLIDLVEYLDSIGLMKKLMKFTYSPIHPTLGPKGKTEEIVSPESMSNYDTEKLIAADKRVKAILGKKGVGTKSGLAASMCPVTTGDNGVTIDTNGVIYKCNAMLGHPELAVGSIFQDEYNERHKSFLAADPWKKCDGDCPYAPLCNTGCRLFSFFKEKDFSAKSCERSYMDTFVPQAIKDEYQNQIKKKAPAPTVSVPA